MLNLASSKIDDVLLWHSYLLRYDNKWVIAEFRRPRGIIPGETAYDHWIDSGGRWISKSDAKITAIYQLPEDKNA